MKKILSIFLIALIAASLLTVPVQATCTVAGSASASTVYVGDTVKVTFTFTSSDANIVGAELSVSFSSGTLTYSSYTSSLGSALENVGSNTIKVNDFNAKSTSKKYTLTITFKAKAVGDATVTYTGGEFFDINADYIGAPASKTVKISIKEKNKSSNCNLASLEGPAGYGFSPKFSPSVTEYSVTVPNSVDSYSLKWAKEDANATAKSLDSVELKVGDNQRRIKVTAPDGTTKTYTVKIKRLAAAPVDETPAPTPTISPELTPPPEIKVSVDGKEYNVIASITLPLIENFVKEEVFFKGHSVEIATLGKISIMQLTDGEDDTFFVFDKDSQTFTTFNPIAINSQHLVFLDFLPSEVMATNAFTSATLYLEDRLYPAWTNPAFEDGYYIVNVLNSATGEDYVAIYCNFDATVQRLSSKLYSQICVVGTDADVSVDDKEPLKIDWMLVGAIVCGFFLVGTLVAIIVLSVKKCKERKPKVKRNWNLETDEVDPYNFVIEETESPSSQNANEPDEDFE